MVLDTSSADPSKRLILFRLCQNKLETMEINLALIKLAYGDAWSYPMMHNFTSLGSAFVLEWALHHHPHHHLLNTTTDSHPLSAVCDALEDLQLYLHTSGWVQHLISAKNTEISVQA